MTKNYTCPHFGIWFLGQFYKTFFIVTHAKLQRFSTVLYLCLKKASHTVYDPLILDINKHSSLFCLDITDEEKRGQGKSTALLSANVNVLSAPPHLLVTN